MRPLDDPPPARVLFFVPRFPEPTVGGLERQSFELVRLLESHGRKVSVLSTKFADSHISHEDLGGVRVYRLPHALPFRHGWDIARFMFRKRGEYDVVHVHNISWVCTPVLLTAHLLGRPTLIKLPNVGAFGIPGTVRRRFGKLWLAVFRLADAVVAMSDESLRELADIGYPMNQVLRVTNGVDVAKFARTVDAHTSSVRVVFAGRLSEEKGLLDLLAVWPTIVLRHPGVTLEIFGEGPQRSELAAHILKHGLGESVYLKGHVADVRIALSNADVFVLPSYAEGNSNAILEAMASGLPIVSTLVGGTKRIVGVEGLPFICSPGDREGLQVALMLLIGDAKLRASVGRLMLERVQKLFDIASVAELYGRAYDVLAARRLQDLQLLRSPAWDD